MFLDTKIIDIIVFLLRSYFLYIYVGIVCLEYK